jgi:YVTN family beta-propeller protein
MRLSGFHRLLAFLFVTASCLLIGVPSAAVGGTITTIPVGAEPVGVAVNSLTDKTYVATRADNAVTVIQGLSVVATVPVGTYPRWLAVNPVTNKVYVTNYLSDNVSVIDGSTDQVVATIPVGARPFGVAANPVTNKVYVASWHTNSLWVIDGARDTVIKRLPVREPGPWGVAVNTVTNRIYVGSVGGGQNLGGSVSVIDGATDSLITVIDAGRKTNPATPTVNEATNKIYIGDQCLGGVRKNTRECGADIAAGRPVSVTVIDGASNTVVDDVSVGSLPFGPFADSERNTVYVPIIFENRVSLIDGATDSVIGTEPVGACPASAGVNTSTNRVYVSNLCDSTVSVLTRH